MIDEHASETPLSEEPVQLSDALGSASEATREVNRWELIKLMLDAEDHAIIPLLVTGSSMSPTLLNRKSVVYLERDRSYVPERGDIVFFCRPDGALVLHRVLRLLEDGTLLINGDAQQWTEIIDPIQVVAHVVRFRRTKRETDVNSRAYRFYVRMWMPLRPIHPYLWRFCYICKRIPVKLHLCKNK